MRQPILVLAGCLVALAGCGGKQTQAIQPGSPNISPGNERHVGAETFGGSGSAATGTNGNQGTAARPSGASGDNSVNNAAFGAGVDSTGQGGVPRGGGTQGTTGGATQGTSSGGASSGGPTAGEPQDAK